MIMFDKKDIVRGGIIAGTIVVFYNILAFLIPFEHTGTFWLSYAFTWLAFVVSFGSIGYSFSNGADAKNWFYGFPVAKAGATYLVVQFVLGFVGMIFADYILTWIWLIILVIPLVIAVISITAADSTRDEIKRMDEKLATDVHNIRALQSKSSFLPTLCSDSALTAELEDLAEKFRYSDPVSSKYTMKLECDLFNLLVDIEAAIVDNQAADVSALCKKDDLSKITFSL